MMNPYGNGYGYGYSMYYGMAQTVVIALIVAIILGVVLYFTFLNKKNEGKYTGIKEKIYNFLNFNKFCTEDILKLLYVVLTSIITILGIVIMFASFISGLMLLIVGNVVLRVGYELIMMFIIMCRKTLSIDRKLDKITAFYGDDFDVPCDCECDCDEDADDCDCGCGGSCDCGDDCECGDDCGCDCDCGKGEADINASDR